MPEIKKHIGVDSDLSFSSLSCALERIKEEFDFVPESATLEVCIDSIFVGIDIKELKHQFALKNLWFRCKKDFPDYYWQIVVYRNNNFNERYIIFSRGA